MNKEIENNEWIELAPSLAKMNRRNPFATPINYFETLEQQTNNAIFLAEMAENKHNYGLEVPEDYFLTLFTNIGTTIKLTEKIKSESAFEVPADYFSQLQDKLAAKTAPRKATTKPKIVRLWHKNLVKYASAACLVLVSSFGIYYYNQHVDLMPEVSATETTQDQFLYDIDESTIIQQINTEQPVESKNVSATDTEMENYLLNHYTTTELAQEL
ncbi:hypothetical protein ABIB40_001532 [Pedobacter sp. UYP30]|uniref:hypothetical protein n=1 Tax=Pedobacter sp. UYP30 TaxID=1756400 RepID=UPI003393A767